MRIYLHIFLPDRHLEAPETLFYETSEGDTLQTIVDHLKVRRLEVLPQYVQIKSHLNGQPITNRTFLLTSFLSDNSDLYFYCGILNQFQSKELPRPILKEETVKTVDKTLDTIRYVPIKDYSFYDTENWTVKQFLIKFFQNFRINFPMPRIGTIPKENITCTFLEQSFELKVHDYKNKNWQFAVPRTEDHLNPEKSKLIIKDDELQIIIYKSKKEHRWYSLYRKKDLFAPDNYAA